MSETKLMVWIDQDLCTGDGICEEIAPTSSWDATTAVGRQRAGQPLRHDIVFDGEEGDGHGPRAPAALLASRRARSTSSSNRPRNAPASAS